MFKSLDQWKRPLQVLSFSVALAIFLASNIALATVIANDSWQKIRSDSSVDIRQGPYAYTFGPEGFFNACVDQSHDGGAPRLWNIRPVPKSCHTASTPGGALECSYYAPRTISLPLRQAIQTCTQYSDSDPDVCLKYQDLSVKVPTRQVFDVFTAGVWTGSKLLFSKVYVIPDCNSADHPSAEGPLR